MNYRVVVANEWRNMIVEVDAEDPSSARETARWIVEHRKHGDAHGIPQGSPVTVSVRARPDSPVDLGDVPMNAVKAPTPPR